MSKTKKYSLAYWAKKCMNAWTPEKDILLAVQTLIKIGSHPEIDFSGTPLELATALYLERFKRGTPWSGFFPTPAPVADRAAEALNITSGMVVLDPGCGFGSLSRAVEQRGGIPIPVEYSNAVIPIAQAIWGDDRIHYADFTDGFRPPAFDAVIVNPPYGKVFGSSDATLDFMTRIADLSKSNTRVVAILPRGYMQKERPKANVTLRTRFMLINEFDLPPDTFKPLTHIATTLYVLGVTKDGALVNELQAKPKETKPEDHEVYKLQNATPSTPDPELDEAEEEQTVRTFGIEVDGDLVRVDYDPKRQIGPDVCFNFHGPTVSATGYITRFAAREPAEDLYALAQREAHSLVAAWQKQRVNNQRAWPVKYAGDVAVQVDEQVVRGYPISWNDHDQEWRIWLRREARVVTLKMDDILENWVTYFATHLQSGDHIVYRELNHRVEADVVRVVPGTACAVEVTRRHDGWKCFVSPADLVGLWDAQNVSPAERGETFSVPNFGIANTDPLDMMDDAFTAWAAAIEETSPQAAAGWRQVRAEKQATGCASWPRLSADDNRPRAELPGQLRQWYAAHPTQILQHSTSTAYEAWGDDHLTIMQPQGERGLPWTVCYATRLPSAQDAGEYVPLLLTLITPGDDMGNVQGATLFEALAVLREHLQGWGVETRLTLQPRDSAWNATVLRELLEIISRGAPVLIADDDLGLPTIHHIPNPEHMGFGTFRSVTEDYTVNWDAGGSMNRLSNGRGWTTVQVERGTFPYDFAQVKQTIEHWIAEFEAQAPRFSITTLHVDTTHIERDFAAAAQAAQGKEPWQMRYNEFMATQRPISSDAQGRMLLDLILAHARDVQASNDNESVSAKISSDAIVWLTDLRKTLVHIALAELKPVPVEVLADYPDLAVKYPDQSAADASEPVTPVTAEPLPPTTEIIAPVAAKSAKSKRGKKQSAPEPRVDYPAVWHKRDKFEFYLDGAIVVAEYDGSDSIGFDHGSLEYDFHGPTISMTGFRSHFANFADVESYGDPVNAAIAIARDLAAVTAKEVAKNKKTWPMKYAGNVEVRLEDGRTVRGTPISWNDFNQWWCVWLIEARTARTIKPDEMVGVWPIPASSSVETPPARNPFDLERAAFEAWVQRTDPQHAGLWAEAYRYFAESYPLSERAWAYLTDQPHFNAQRQTIDPHLKVNPFDVQRDLFIQWVKAQVDGATAQSAYLQGYVHLTTGSDVLLPEARAYLATQRHYTSALAARQSASPDPSDTTQPVKPIKRPAGLPDDIPEVIEVDVGGRVPQWIAATIVKVAGGKQLTCNRSDGRGEFKTPIYGRDITWRVPASVGA